MNKVTGLMYSEDSRTVVDADWKDGLSGEKGWQLPWDAVCQTHPCSTKGLYMKS